MPLEQQRTFTIHLPFPATASELIANIWRMCPGQYYRSITALQFTSPPLSDGFTLDPTLPPDTLSIIPHTPAAKQHLPLSPYTSHFVHVDLTPRSRPTKKPKPAAPKPPSKPPPLPPPHEARHPTSATRRISAPHHRQHPERTRRRTLRPTTKLRTPTDPTNHARPSTDRSPRTAT